MQKRYGLYGLVSQDFLTYGGKILWHTNQHELEFLIKGTIKIREIPPSISDEHMLHISKHPKMWNVQFPLRRGDFRNTRS